MVEIKSKIFMTKCFLCSYPVSCLSTHLHCHHHKCKTCKQWISQKNKAHTCTPALGGNHDTKVAAVVTFQAPEASSSGSSSKSTSANKGWMTKKCDAHLFQKLSFQELRACRKCRIVRLGS